MVVIDATVFTLDETVVGDVFSDALTGDVSVLDASIFAVDKTDAGVVDAVSASILDASGLEVLLSDAVMEDAFEGFSAVDFFLMDAFLDAATTMGSVIARSVAVAAAPDAT